MALLLSPEAGANGPDLPADARIDAHVSLWREAPPEARLHPCFPGDDRSYLPEHIGPILLRSRFDAALIVTTGSGEPERETLAEWIAESPFLWGAVAGWSSDLPASPAVASMHRAGKLRGVWTHMAASKYEGASSWRDALAWCQQHRLALELATPAAGSHFEAVLAPAEAATVPLVLAELAGAPADNHGLAGWMEAMRALARQPNVFVKISGLHSSPTRAWPVAQVAALVEFLLGSFGPERLMFGSGWPFCLPDHAWKECLARFTQALGPRDQGTRELLLGATAQRAYHLEGNAQRAQAPATS